MLTPPEVCELLGVKNVTLQDWRRENRGPAFVRFGHRTVRYRESVVHAWLTERSDERADD